MAAFINAGDILTKYLDTNVAAPLNLGAGNATQVNIGSTGIETAVLGTFRCYGTPQFDNRYFNAYSTSTSNISSGLTDVSWNVERRKDSIYTHSANSAEVQISTAGDYEIIYTVATNVSSGGNRSESEAAVFRKPNAGAYSEVAGTRIYMYNRTASGGYGSGTRSIVLTIAANDTVKVQAARTVGTSTIVLINGGCGITIRKL